MITMITPMIIITVMSTAAIAPVTRASGAAPISAILLSILSATPDEVAPLPQPLKGMWWITLSGKYTFHSVISDSIRNNKDNDRLRYKIILVIIVMIMMKLIMIIVMTNLIRMILYNIDINDSNDNDQLFASILLLLSVSLKQQVARKRLCSCLGSVNMKRVFFMSIMYDIYTCVHWMMLHLFSRFRGATLASINLR